MGNEHAVEASRVVVVDAATPTGRRIVAALEGAGAQVVPVADQTSSPRAGERTVDLDDLAEVRAAFAAVAEEGPIDAVVLSALGPEPLVPQSLLEGGPEQWELRCERPMRVALHVTAAAHAPLRATAGALVFLCPTVGLQGASGYVALSGASEGQRVLAKSAARQWAGDRIRVNILAPGMAALLEQPPPPGSEDARRGRAPLADRADFDLDALLLGALGFLVGGGSRLLSGTTVVADGLQVMAL